MPSSTEKVKGRPEGGKLYERPNDLMEFKYKERDELIKNAFAIVYNNDLYFNIKAIDKNKPKSLKGNGATNATDKQYLRVKFKNNDYYYTDAPIVSTNPLIFGGGIIGALISQALEPKTGGYIPIVLLNKEKLFYKTVSCKHFNQYLDEILNTKFDCDKKDEYIISNIRKQMIHNPK